MAGASGTLPVRGSHDLKTMAKVLSVKIEAMRAGC